MRLLLRRIAGVACLLGGLALLGTAGVRWGHAQAAQSTFRDQVVSRPPPVLEETEAAPGPEPIAPEREYTQGEPLFRVRIPAIAIDNVVVYGTTDSALDRGPGLVERTALPGRPGNAVVAAHRDFYFWRLGELKPGDEIQIESTERTVTYVVTGSRVVKETETAILDPTPEPTLTLFTCWPLFFAGRSPERLVVTAVLQAN